MELKLPENVVTTTDLSRVIREMEALDGFMAQAAIRQPGSSMALPKLSKMLEDTSKVNNINLLDKKSREGFMTALDDLHEKAPRVHISFAAAPNASFVQKIVDWFRKEVNPSVLLQIGLQPTIAAGCALRTPNKYFDFSLRKHLLANRGMLVEKIHAASEAPSK